MIQIVGLLQSDCAVSSKQDHFSMGRTELRAQAAVYLEHDLYTHETTFP